MSDFNSMEYVRSLLSVISTINDENVKRIKSDLGTTMVHAELLENLEMINNLVENFKRESKKERMLTKLV